MDDGSIISIQDSDISFHTLIDDVETVRDDSTKNQQFYICSLFVNHWVDGKVKTGQELRSAKKDYIKVLQEKPTDSDTVNFGKKASADEEMTLIRSRSGGNTSCEIKKRRSIEHDINSNKKQRFNEDESKSSQTNSSSVHKVARELNSTTLDKSDSSIKLGVTSSLKAIISHEPKMKHYKIPKYSEKEQQMVTSTTSKERTIKEFTSKASTSKASTSKASTSKASTSKASTSKASTSKASTSKASTSKASTSKASTSKASPSKERKSTGNKSTHNKATENTSTEIKSTKNASKENKSSENKSTKNESNKNKVTEDKSTQNKSTKNTLKENKSTKDKSTTNKSAENKSTTISTAKTPKANLSTPTTSLASKSRSPETHTYSKNETPKHRVRSDTRNGKDEKRKSIAASSSPQNASQSKNHQNVVDNKIEFAGEPELESESDNIKVNPKLVLLPLKLNLLSGKSKIKEEVVVSDKESYITQRMEDNKKTTEDTKRKWDSEENDHESIRETNNVPAEEVANNSVAVEEVAINEATADKVATSYNTHESRADMIFQDIHVRLLDNKININSRAQVDYTQQTEMSTSDFGAQKNDDETNELMNELKQQISSLEAALIKYKKDLKERDQEIDMNQKTIDEQRMKIEEREKVIEERNLWINERDNKNKEYESLLKVQQLEAERLLKERTVLIDILTEKDMECQKNHKDKPKPKKRRKVPQPGTNPLPNALAPSDSNRHENEMLRTSPLQNCSSEIPFRQQSIPNVNGLQDDIQRISPLQNHGSEIPFRQQTIPSVNGVQNNIQRISPLKDHASSIPFSHSTIPNCNGLQNDVRLPMANHYTHNTNKNGNEAPTSIGNIASPSIGNTSSYSNINAPGTSNRNTVSNFNGNSDNAFNSYVAATSYCNAVRITNGNVSHFKENAAPTFTGTAAPTFTGTAAPTFTGTAAPTFTGTAAPTFTGTAAPTFTGTAAPTFTGTAAPTFTGTAAPTFTGTTASTLNGNAVPTFNWNTDPTFNGNAVRTFNGNAVPTLNQSASFASTVTTSPTSMNGATPTTANNAAFKSNGYNSQSKNSQNSGVAQIQGPNVGWTVSLSNSSASINLQNPNNSTQFMAFTQQSGLIQPGTMSMSRNAPQLTPHQMLPPQPVEKSFNSNNSVTSDDTAIPTQIPTSQLRNRSNTYVPAAHNFTMNAQEMSHQNVHQLQTQQKVLHQQLLTQSSVAQRSFDTTEPVFYCLSCCKTAIFVCKTCRNYCACSQFCNELIARKHKNECKIPNMVPSSIL